MYNHFFQLKQAPFSIAPDPHYLFMSERHREALAHLLYGVQCGGGFVLLTGEIGAGKTTVCRCLLEQIPENCQVAYIFNPKLSVLELLQTICEEFRIAEVRAGATAKEYFDALNRHLLQCHAAGQNNVLIIDEAQNLAPEVLEQLRLLTNLETSERKLLQIILIGQPELRDMLARPELEQMAQRVIARYHLGPLSREDTASYIQYRLATAGAMPPYPFAPTLIPQIHQLTRGIPRRINLLCDRALLGAYAANRREVTPEILSRAAAEVFGRRPSPAIALRRHWRVAAATFAGASIAVAIGWFVASGPHREMPWTITSRQAPLKLDASLTSWNAAVRQSKPYDRPDRLVTAARGNAGVPEPVEDLASLLSRGTHDQAAAYRLLGQQWGIALKRGDACQIARNRNVHCYFGKGGLDEIRRLNRPAVLSLRDAGGATHHALLSMLGTTEAVLQLPGRSRPVSIGVDKLARYFPGEFATFWRAPPDYRPILAAGERGAHIDWLAAQLARLHGNLEMPPGQAFGPALAQQIREFQATQGLIPDGVAGPHTMMALNQATSVYEPRLGAIWTSATNSAR